MNQEWWKKSVVYQIYPKSFNDTNGDGIGDIPGIIEKLDYLKELGVDVLWLSPVYDSPQEDNGYDIRNYRQVDDLFGKMEDLERLLEEAHKRDLKLVMDLVVNHTSDEHPWFVESAKSKDHAYRDYYIWKDGKEDGGPPNNWNSVFGGPAWEYDEGTGQYYLHIFAKKQPDLNWENPKLREDIYDMMKFWLDKGMDGFRMDVINFISKDPEYPDGENGDGSPFFMNGPRVHEFLHEMNKEVLAHYDVLTVGEMPGASPEDAKRYTDPENEELNMIFTFEHMDIDSDGDKWNWTDLNLVDLKANFEKWQTSLHGVGWNSLYWNNHDQPRIVSRFGDDGAYRVKSAKMLAIGLHMMQGTPYIYQGEELGMTNVNFATLEEYRDIELLNMYEEKKQQGWSHEDLMKAIYVKGRDNARTPMQWNGTENGGFTEGTPWIQVNPNYTEINAEAALEDDQSVFYFYKQLIRLRKEVDVITNGRFELLMKDDPQVFAYKRIDGEEDILVACNFSSEEVVLDEELYQQVSGKPVMITNEVDNSNRRVLSPYEGIVYRI